MRSSLFTLPLALASLAGCAGTVPPQGDADAEASGTATAVVVVERTVAPGASESTRAEAVARFVRMRAGAVDDDALRMVGAAADFPALGTCAQLPSGSSARAGAASVSPVRPVSLVDVGAVTLEAASTAGFSENGSSATRISLVPRQLPDVADVVSGVLYAARPADSALPARSKYILRAAGSPELDIAPFTALATAPAEPSDLRVAGKDVRLSGTIDVASLSPIDITWEPGAIDDFVYIDVAGASAAASAPVVRCLFADAGRASLPAAAFTAVDDGTLTVHRLHRESFHAPGVDPGEVRFDFARVVAISRH